MNYRYRVQGRVEKPFILRGMFFGIGADIDNYITEKELVFVKERCALTKIVDIQAVSPKPIPTNSTETDRGVKDDSKSTSRVNKVKPFSKV